MFLVVANRILDSWIRQSVIAFPIENFSFGLDMYPGDGSRPVDPILCNLRHFIFSVYRMWVLTKKKITSPELRNRANL